MKNISEKVKEIIAEYLGERRENVCDDSNILDDLAADSLEVIELAMAFEEEFSIEINNEEMEKLVTVADVVRCIEEKVAAKK